MRVLVMFRREESLLTNCRAVVGADLAVCTICPDIESDVNGINGRLFFGAVGELSLSIGKRSAVWMSMLLVPHDPVSADCDADIDERS